MFSRKAFWKYKKFIMFAFGNKGRMVMEAVIFILYNTFCLFFYYLLGYLPGEIIQLFFFLVFILSGTKIKQQKPNKCFHCI